MSFVSIPAISKKRIDKAGDILAEKLSPDGFVDSPIEILNKWRLCHAYPINTFQSTLRTKLSRGDFGEDYIVAQRLKRSSTVIEKLKEIDGMRLTRMQDIAGVRAILPTIQDVRALEAQYRDSERFTHELINFKDYIHSPKNETGYRSLHFIYRYNNERAVAHNGLLIELQIRTKLQHSWATAVETMQTFIGQTIKTRDGVKGSKKWKDFFMMTSSAFAFLEGTAPVSSHSHMSQQEVFNAVALGERKLKVIEKMQAYPVAINIINKATSSNSYHLILLNMRDRRVSVESFGRDSLTEAYEKYTEFEERAKTERHLDPLLVSATAGDLQKAYSSFFVDSKEFIQNLRMIIRKSDI